MLWARELQRTQEAGANPAANSVLRNGIQDELPGERKDWMKEVKPADKQKRLTLTSEYDDDTSCR